jgi:hypothetical protein
MTITREPRAEPSVRTAVMLSATSPQARWSALRAVARLSGRTEHEGLRGFWRYTVWMTEHCATGPTRADVCDSSRSDCAESRLGASQRAQPTKLVTAVRARLAAISW